MRFFSNQMMIPALVIALGMSLIVLVESLAGNISPASAAEANSQTNDY